MTLQQPDPARCSNIEAARAEGLRPVQLGWLAGSVFIVSAGYGALLPALPGWLALMMPGVSAGEVGRHVGYLSGVYAAGVLLGAPLGESCRTVSGAAGS